MSTKEPARPITSKTVLHDSGDVTAQHHSSIPVFWSPRLVAQRKTIQALFGTAINRSPHTQTNANELPTKMLSDTSGRRTKVVTQLVGSDSEEERKKQKREGKRKVSEDEGYEGDTENTKQMGEEKIQEKVENLGAKLDVEMGIANEALDNAMADPRRIPGEKFWRGLVLALRGVAEVVFLLGAVLGTVFEPTGKGIVFFIGLFLLAISSLITIIEDFIARERTPLARFGTVLATVLTPIVTIPVGVAGITLGEDMNKELAISLPLIFGLLGIFVTYWIKFNHFYDKHWKSNGRNT